jgi:hypothetical protein
MPVLQQPTYQQYFLSTIHFYGYPYISFLISELLTEEEDSTPQEEDIVKQERIRQHTGKKKGPHSVK